MTPHYRCEECGDVWLDAGYHGCRRMARVFMVALAAFAFLACGPQPADTAAPPQQEDRGAFVLAQDADPADFQGPTTVRPKARVSRSRGSTSLTASVHKFRPTWDGNVSALLDRIARCESGGDPQAVSPSGKYRGAWQFDLRTWRSVGMAGDPIQFDYATQKIAAHRLYQSRGVQPWPVCGPRALHGAGE